MIQVDVPGSVKDQALFSYDDKEQGTDKRYAPQAYGKQAAHQVGIIIEIYRRNQYNLCSSAKIISYICICIFLVCFLTNPEAI